MCLFFLLADGIAIVVDVTTTQGDCVIGRCYCHWWLNVIATGQLCRTSSQICGRWYLPTFLLRDRLFALMYRASFISLVNNLIEALFTSVPVEESISIIEKLLEEDKDLHQRTAMSVNQIICLLKFCLNTTYFTFQGKMYEQVRGAAMGSQVSPIVANLFMEEA